MGVDFLMFSDMGGLLVNNGSLGFVLTKSYAESLSLYYWAQCTDLLVVIGSPKTWQIN